MNAISPFKSTVEEPISPSPSEFLRGNTTAVVASLLGAMPAPMVLCALALASIASIAAMAPPALAQYDRDGRYVPSPMGVPRDPHARPIPNYSGRPGEATGTPWEPPLQAAPPLAPLAPRVGPAPKSGSAPLTRARCDGEWTPQLRMTRPEFASRCRKLLQPKS